MRGNPLALQLKCHAKAQRAPSEIYKLLFSFSRELFNLIPFHSENNKEIFDLIPFAILASWQEIDSAAGISVVHQGLGWFGLPRR